MRSEDYENSFKFVNEFLADLNPNFNVDFIRTTFSFNARIEKYPKNIFYYGDEGREIDLWGKNMIEHLQKVYRDLLDHVIIFVSSDYVKKRWARHEWRSIQEAILDRPEEYLLPARFDDADLPGLHKTIGYIELSNKPPEVLAEMIIRKIRSAKKA